MITASEYWTLVRQQEAGLTGDALLNAARSALAVSPFTHKLDAGTSLVEYVTTLPYFTVNADGQPTLVVPPTPAPAPAPLPILTAPPPVVPTTTSPGEGLTTTPDVTATNGCPPGMVPASSLLSTRQAAETPSLAQQVAGAFAAFPQTAGVNGAICGGLTPSLSSGCPVTSNDFIRIVGYNANGTAIVLNVTVRMVLCNGTTSTQQLVVPIPKRVLGLAPVNLGCIRLTEGFLCSVTVWSDGTPCAPGMIFVQGILTTSGCSSASTSINTPVPLVLFQDSITLVGFTGWPNGRVIQPTDVAGGPFGNNWPHETWRNLFWNPDSNTMARLQWVSLQITTSAVAGNRSYQLQYQMVGGGTGYFGTDQTQPPSTTYTWMWAPYLAAGFITSRLTVQTPIPEEVLMTDNDQIGILGFNTDVNDNIVGGGVHYLTYAGATA